MARLKDNPCSYWHTRAQKLTWNPDGTPKFGVPVADKGPNNFKAFEYFYRRDIIPPLLQIISTQNGGIFV
ncbi:MAG TPA: hypothetical protein DDW50_12905 [Firmicutes bacterium]|nr:hypothetical protein [Bacillota bacterium]